MPRQPGFWSVEERLCELSAQGVLLEKLLEIVDYELFRPVLDEARGGTGRSKGGTPPFDAVLKLKTALSAGAAWAELRGARAPGA
ncbi:hypothetical protein SH611_22385 [Geminicoccaceae bacterium 1502E]|nr:hypothetical protein [Geminicoccaceae bacterium 1502E]